MTKPCNIDLDSLLPVLNYLNMGVYVTDLDRRILLWNHKAEEITGHRASDVVGKACHENVLRHRDKDGHELCSTTLCPLHRAMTINRPSREPVLVFALKADGSRVAVSVHTAPLRDAAGQAIGGIETFNDESAAVRDLEFARGIQRNLMPAKLPQAQGVTFNVRYYPHSLIGGDYYDVRALGGDRYAIMVADVRGHGVSAALYTMVLRSLEDSLSRFAHEPARFVTEANRELGRFVVEESFATLFYAVLDAKRWELTCCNAGHPAPLLYHARTGAVTSQESQGLPLGILAEGEYGQETLKLEPGDLLLCYTDGVTEVTGQQGTMIGEAGLMNLLRDGISRGQEELLEWIYRQVSENNSEVSLADDVTLLSVRRDR